MPMLNDGLETSALEIGASGLVLNFLNGYRTESSRRLASASNKGSELPTEKEQCLVNTYGLGSVLHSRHLTPSEARCNDSTP